MVYAKLQVKYRSRVQVKSEGFRFPYMAGHGPFLIWQASAATAWTSQSSADPASRNKCASPRLTQCLHSPTALFSTEAHTVALHCPLHLMISFSPCTVCAAGAPLDNPAICRSGRRQLLWIQRHHCPRDAGSNRSTIATSACASGRTRASLVSGAGREAQVFGNRCSAVGIYSMWTRSEVFACDESCWWPSEAL